MSLLYPLALLGLAAVAVPLWLHMRLHADKIVSFSALRFLEDAPAPRAQGYRLRDLLLLLARIAGLALLVLAFSWPYVRDERFERIRLSQVHILDATLSQRAGERFEADRARILESMEKAPADEEHAVVLLEASPRILFDFGEPYDEVRAHLDSIEPSFQRGAYLDAVRLAQSMLERSLADKRIVVHGDHQENQWSEHESSPAFLVDTELLVPAPPMLRERFNLSLSDPVSRRHIMGEEHLIELSANVRWQGGRAEGRSADEESASFAKRALVRLEANGHEVMARTMDLETSSGQSVLSAAWPVNESASADGWIRGMLSVELEGDALAADNRVHFFVRPLSMGRVGLLARSRYLSAALSPETMQGRWRVRELDLGDIETPAPEPASAASDSSQRGDNLEDVLVIESRFLHSTRGRALVRQYLDEERGVCLFVDRMTPPIRGFIAELGLHPMDGSGSPSTVDAVGAMGTPGSKMDEGFRFIAADHLLFAPFVRGELGKLLDVRVSEHQSLRADGAVAIAYGDSGDGLVFESRMGRGRLLVFPFAFDRSQTNWPLEPSFVPFLDVALQYLRDEEADDEDFTPGELYTFTHPPNQPNAPMPGRLRLRAASMNREIHREDTDVVPSLGQAEFDIEGVARFVLPDEPGLYSLSYDGESSVRAMVSVNPDVLESDLRYSENPVALSSWLRPEDTEIQTSDAASVPSVIETTAYAREQDLWYWLLWGAFLCLVGESAIAARAIGRGSLRAAASAKESAEGGRS